MCIRDSIVAGWIAEHDLKTVLDEFERVEAAIGPAYTIDQIFKDAQYRARGDIIEMDDEDLGKLKMTNAFPFMSETPAEVRFAGPRLGQHNEEIFSGELGMSAAELKALKDEGVI